MYKGLWDSKSGCTILIKGERVIDRSWVRKGIVSEEVRTQGICSACWAWVAAEASEAALKIARGEDVPPLSAQDILNKTYIGRRGCCGGQAITALQWIVETGVAKESDCPYKGTKRVKPTPLAEERFFINGWKVIEDNESKMIEALEKQPVIVQIPYASGVANYKTGLLDLNRADRKHDADLMPKNQHPEEEHSVLLVERGHIKTEDWPFKIHFWVIKNQWRKRWGKKGFGDIIFSSSLKQLKEKLGLKLNNSDWFYTPVVPLVKNSEDDTIYYVDKVRSDLNANDLKKFVEEKPDIALIVLLFHSTSHLKEDPKLLEQFRLVSAMYEYVTNIVQARIDLVEHPTAAEILGVRKSCQPVLVSFPLKEDGKTRSLNDALEFPEDKELKFANMVDWLEDSTGHALEEDFGALDQAIGELTLESEDD